MRRISCGLRDGARAGCPPGVRRGWEEPEVMQGRKELGWEDVGPGGDRSTHIEHRSRSTKQLSSAQRLVRLPVRHHLRAVKTKIMKQKIAFSKARE